MIGKILIYVFYSVIGESFAFINFIISSLKII